MRWLSLTTLDILGALLTSQGDYAAARRNQDQALAIRVEVLGPQDLSVVTTLDHLGAMFRSHGSTEMAVRAIPFHRSNASGQSQPYPALPDNTVSNS